MHKHREGKIKKKKQNLNFNIENSNCQSDLGTLEKQPCKFTEKLSQEKNK